MQIAERAAEIQGFGSFQISAAGKFETNPHALRGSEPVVFQAESQQQQSNVLLFVIAAADRT